MALVWPPRQLGWCQWCLLTVTPPPLPRGGAQPQQLEWLSPYAEDLLFLQSLLCMQHFFSPQLLGGIGSEEQAFLPVKHCVTTVYRTQVGARGAL